MTDALFKPNPSIEFSQAASLLVRAALAEDRDGSQRFQDALYSMFKLGGKVQANFGKGYQSVDAAMNQGGEMMAIAVIQKNLSACDFLQQAASGMIVGYIFDHRDRFWRSHT